MSESSEEKTKRKYLAVLLGYQWGYQYSVFYDDPENCVSLLDDMVGFKQRLRRAFPEQPFLIRVQALKKGAVHQAFLSVITTRKTVGMIELVNKVFSMKMNTVYRTLSNHRISTMANSIGEGKPQDLSKLFLKTGINRWSVLNKEQMVLPGPASECTLV